MTTRRAAFGAIAGAATSATLTAARKPNLVVFLADDMGYGDISCYGSPDVPTPHIDALARTGTRFTDGYVSAAVCSPSRAALLTGRYQHRFGHEFNSGDPEREYEVGFGLPSSEKVLPQLLKSSGYRSGAFGKWHLGVRPGYHPLDRGFDEFVGFLPGGNDFITGSTPGAQFAAVRGEGDKMPVKRRHSILKGRETTDDTRYLTEMFAEEAAGFVDRNRDNPFFLYVPFNAIHTPLQATTRYLDRFANIKEPKHRMLAAMTAALDDGIGLVMSRIRTHKLEDDTLVVFLSDNGCPEMTGAGTNGPLNGEKVSYYEGGIRVPFVMNWPGKVPRGKTFSDPIVSRDIVPTFLAEAGVNAPGVEFDGVNLLPHLNGRAKGVPHEALFWRAGQARVVRRGNWKLLEFGDNYSKLYDLAADLGETKDVSGANPGVVRELREAFAAWSSRMAKPSWPPRFRNVTINGTTLNWEL